jgi:hypothetical protein
MIFVKTSCFVLAFNCFSKKRKMVQAIILQGTLKSSKNTMLENDNIDLS